MARRARLAMQLIGGIARTSFAAGKLVGWVKARRRSVGRGAKTAGLELGQTRRLPVFAGIVAGATGAYFFDPQNGKRRRSIARDKAMKLVRQGFGEAQRRARYASGKVEGAVQERTPSPRDPERDLNDAALARKIESEIFRGADSPKGKVNINVEHGVVYLLGEVASPGQAGALTQAARRVEGVKDVESLLHLPDTPAKSKEGRPKAQSTS
jgi:hypothetical protein